MSSFYLEMDYCRIERISVLLASYGILQYLHIAGTSMHIIAKRRKPLFLLACGEAACENDPVGRWCP